MIFSLSFVYLTKKKPYMTNIEELKIVVCAILGMFVIVSKNKISTHVPILKLYASIEIIIPKL